MPLIGLFSNEKENMRDLTVFNLDKLVEGVYGSTHDVFGMLTYSKLEKKLMGHPYTIFLDNDDYFALFRLIAEQPQKAIGLLEKAAKYQSDADKQRHKGYFEKAKEPNKKFFKKAKQELHNRFLDMSIGGPVLHPWITCELLAVVKYDPPGSLDFFQECYEQMLNNNKIDPFFKNLDWDEIKKEIPVVVDALITRNFSLNTPNNLRFELTPLQLYKDHTESFINYFSNIKDIEKKKDILRALLNYRYENKEVINWLDKKHSKLLRDVGLESDKEHTNKPSFLKKKLTFAPQEEIMRIPRSIKYMNLEGLVLHFMKKEKSYFAGTAFFDNEFIAIIPKEGHTDWRQGVYTLHICGENYGDDLPGKVDYICKIESCRSEEDLKSKLQIDKKKYPKNMVHHGAYSMVPKNYKK